MHIRSKDTVVVITGKDKGKDRQGSGCFPKTGKVVVEGVAIATKHQKPRQQACRAASSRRKPPSTPAT